MRTRRHFLQACGALAALPFVCLFKDGLQKGHDGNHIIIDELHRRQDRKPPVLWKWRTTPAGYVEP